jgi:hypothetical protein
MEEAKREAVEKLAETGAERQKRVKNKGKEKRQAGKPAVSWKFLNVFGGAEGDRTPGLGIANAALSQLSYCPTVFTSSLSLFPKILLIVACARL